MNNVFITGANGFLGKHLTALLSSHNIRFTAGTRQLYGDFTTFSDWKSLLKDHDVVIHLLARVHVMDEKSEDPLLAFRNVNVKSTLQLAEAAKKSGVKRFIFISSIKVNGEETFERPFSPSDRPAPLDPYGISKMEAERELMKLHENGVFEVVIIRPPLIYGKEVKANFKNLFKLVEKKIPIPFGLVKNQRSLVSVLNLSDLIIHCINHPNASGEIFLVADKQDYSLKEIIENMGKVLNIHPILLNIPVSFMKLGLRIIGKKNYADRLFGNLQVSIQKNKELLNWNPKYSFEETFK